MSRVGVTWRLAAAGAAFVALSACQTVRSALPSLPPPLGEPDSVSRYGCSDGQALSAAFHRGRGAAVVSRGGGFSVTLPARPAASGLWYADDRWELRGQGPEVTFGKVGEDAVVCRVVG